MAWITSSSVWDDGDDLSSDPLRAGPRSGAQVVGNVLDHLGVAGGVLDALDRPPVSECSGVANPDTAIVGRNLPVGSARPLFLYLPSFDDAFGAGEETIRSAAAAASASRSS